MTRLNLDAVNTLNSTKEGYSRFYWIFFQTLASSKKAELSKLMLGSWLDLQYSNRDNLQVLSISLLRTKALGWMKLIWRTFSILFNHRMPAKSMVMAWDFQFVNKSVSKWKVKSMSNPIKEMGALSLLLWESGPFLQTMVLEWTKTKIRKKSI